MWHGQLLTWCFCHDLDTHKLVGIPFPCLFPNKKNPKRPWLGSSAPQTILIYLTVKFPCCLLAFSTAVQNLNASGQLWYYIAMHLMVLTLSKKEKQKSIVFVSFWGEAALKLALVGMWKGTFWILALRWCKAKEAVFSNELKPLPSDPMKKRSFFAFLCVFFFFFLSAFCLFRGGM